MLCYPEATVPSIARPRNGSHQSGSLNTGNSASSLQQVLKKAYTLNWLRVFCFRETETHREHVICDATQMGGAQFFVTLQQQAGPDEQHHGKPYFQRKKPFAKPNPPE